MTRKPVVALIALLIVAVARGLLAGPDEQPLSGSFTNWIDHPAIAYRATARADPVAALIRRMDAHQVALTDENGAGYLRSLLNALGVPIESRQFDLTQRLFRYRCSYLVYTDLFEHLPRAARDAIFERMWQILSGQERDQRYKRLTLEDRKAVVEILRDTMESIPAYFRTVSR